MKFRFSLPPSVLALLIPGLLLAPYLKADVYKFVSRSGQVFYTDRPSHAGFKLVVKSPAREKPAENIVLGAARKPATGVALQQPLAFRTSGQAARNRTQFAGLIEAAAYQHGLDPALLHAVIQAESSYNPEALSSKGAMGLMQLMPGTAARFGVSDPWDPGQNIWGGARYLSQLLSMFGSDVALAVAAYNAGENNVIKYGNRVPPFSETRDYVARVLGHYYNGLN